MKAAMGYADTVVNLIGKHYETKHIVFQRQEDGSISRINSSFKNVSVIFCIFFLDLAWFSICFFLHGRVGCDCCLLSFCYKEEKQEQRCSLEQSD